MKEPVTTYIAIAVPPRVIPTALFKANIYYISILLIIVSYLRPVDAKTTIKSKIKLKLSSLILI